MANFSKTTPGSGGDLDSEFHSLTEYLMTTLKDQELTVLMSQMALACKATSRACAKAIEVVEDDDVLHVGRV